MSAAYADSLRLDAILGDAVYAGSGLLRSRILILGVIAFALQAFVGRIRPRPMPLVFASPLKN